MRQSIGGRKQLKDDAEFKRKQKELIHRGDYEEVPY